MQYTNLGNSGLKVSRICLGTMSYGTSKWRDWVLDEEESREHIQRALEMGINFFDTANMYADGVSEEVVGRALNDFAKRDEVVVATKGFFDFGEKPNQGGLSRKALIQAFEDSLERLGMEYVDLYQIHRWDYETPIEETLEALHDLVRSGRVRYIGASSMFAYQFAKSLYLADLKGWTRFVSMQNHYNLIYREEEREMNKLCVEEGVGLIPWSPLARGFLAGNRTRDKEKGTKRAKLDNLAHERYYHDNDFEIVDRVVELAKKKDASPAQVALAWILNRPGVTAPIIGATKIEHLEQSVAALEIVMSEEDMTYLEEVYEPHWISGHS